MKKLIILFLLALMILPSVLLSQTCAQNLTKAKVLLQTNVKYLKEAQRIIEQERERWASIHIDQETSATVRKIDETRYEVIIALETYISNEINTMPIERKFIAKLDDPNMKYFPFEFMIYPCFSVGLTADASIGLGLTLLSLEPLPIRVLEKIRFNANLHYPLKGSLTLNYNLNFLIFKYSYISVGMATDKSIVAGLAFKI